MCDLAGALESALTTLSLESLSENEEALVHEAIDQVAVERTCEHCLAHTGVTLPFELP